MIEIQERIHTLITSILAEWGIPEVDFVVERPTDPANGDFASNVAMVAYRGFAKAVDSNVPGVKHEGVKWSIRGNNPREVAENISQRLRELQDPNISTVEVAGAGFINIRLSETAIRHTLDEAAEKKNMWGTNERLKGKKVIIEYTDPNPFKEFHIGHLLPNTIGESLSRILEANGAEVRRVNYQGDVGMHVAMAIWGIMHSHEEMPHEDADLRAKANFMGKAYAKGAKAYQEDEKIHTEIASINKKVYEGSDPLVSALYKNGKRWSLEYFEMIYKLLGTKFDRYFFESETAEFGKTAVLASLGEIFERSDGAVVFPGERYGFHTRVFINSEGIPTYEAKELGLAKLKYEYFPYDRSIVVTGNEISDYFKVLIEAMAKVYAKEGLAERTAHIAHGMLRLSTGKLSSRQGNVVTALELIDDAKAKIAERMSEKHEFTDADRVEVAERAAVGAVKYSILRQEIGKDIIFDFDRSLSFDGDSGPYLEYTLARIKSLLRKAEETGIRSPGEHTEPIGDLERMVVRFPEVVLRAGEGLAPHHIANYLVMLAHAFNAYYGKMQIVSERRESAYRVHIARAVGTTLENGLHMLAIPVLERM